MPNLRALLAFTSLLAVSACATSGLTEGDPSRALIGVWDNSTQMASAPEALKRPPVAGGAYEWIDGQHATFFPANVPALTGDGAKAIYLVWRNGGPSGPISRQRLWVFRTAPDGQKSMDFYAFKTAAAFETVSSGGEAFKAISLDDLTAYGPLCTLPIVPVAGGWSAAIPETCAITARSGRKMVLSARIEVTGNALYYSEQGTLESGALAFKVPGGPPYHFVRVRGR
jgi:CpeT/CpcT family (DUF1001)